MSHSEKVGKPGLTVPQKTRAEAWSTQLASWGAAPLVQALGSAWSQGEENAHDNVYVLGAGCLVLSGGPGKRCSGPSCPKAHQLPVCLGVGFSSGVMKCSGTRQRSWLYNTVNVLNCIVSYS